MFNVQLLVAWQAPTRVVCTYLHWRRWREYVGGALASLRRHFILALRLPPHSPNNPRLQRCRAENHCGTVTKYVYLALNNWSTMSHICVSAMQRCIHLWSVSIYLDLGDLSDRHTGTRSPLCVLQRNICGEGMLSHLIRSLFVLKERPFSSRTPRTTLAISRMQ